MIPIMSSINQTWQTTLPLIDNHTHKPSTEGGIFSGNGVFPTGLSRFLVQAVIIIALSRFLHIFLRKLRQPRVIAEVISGIMLGPSMLGRIPGFKQTFFPDDSNAILGLVANIGLVFYLFLVGLELEPQVFFNNIRTSAIISLAGIILPFLVGVACSYGLYSYLLVPNVNNVPFLSFMLFTGVAISITAFPVLARILTEKKLLATPVGTTAISAAAIDDAVAWTLLALVISILHAKDQLTALYVFLVAGAYAAILLLAVRPMLRAIFNKFWAKDSAQISQFLIATVFILVFLSAWLTEMIGVHAIFGAFLMGLAIPRMNNLSMRLTEKVEDVVLIAFLPLFFAFSGLRTNIGLLDDWATWFWLFVVIFTACFGKMVGCTLAAKLVGKPWREAVSIGLLMNTKGLVELIVLNLGYEAGVINQRIFLVMVVMALVTTFMTSPLLSIVYPSKYHNVLGGQRNVIERLSVVSSTSRLRSRRKGKITTIPEESNGTRDGIAFHEPLRLLLFLDDDLNMLLLLARLASLFTVDDDYDCRESLGISALKIIEPSERSSSVILAHQIDEAVKTDTSLNMIRMFAEMINVNMRSLASVSPASDVGEEVSFFARSEDSHLVLAAFSEQKVIGSIMSSSPQEKLRDILRAVRHATVGVFATKRKFVPVDETAMPQNIAAVYVGGPEDDEAVKIATRFAKHAKSPTGTTVTILHYPDTMSHISVIAVDDEDQKTSDVSAMQDARALSNQSGFDHFRIQDMADNRNIHQSILVECSKLDCDLLILPRKIQESSLHHQKVKNLRKTSLKNSSSSGGGIFRQNFSLKNLRKGSSASVSNGESYAIENNNDDRKNLERSISSDQRQDPAPEIWDPDQYPLSLKRKDIVAEILGVFGKSFFENDDMKASMLVVSRND